jgi:hypothetical protein
MKLYEGIRGGTYFLRGGQKVYVSRDSLQGGVIGSSTIRALKMIIQYYPQWLPVVYEIAWQIFHSSRSPVVHSPDELLDLYNYHRDSKGATDGYGLRVYSRQTLLFKESIILLSNIITLGTYDPSHYEFDVRSKTLITKEHYHALKEQIIKHDKEEEERRRSYIPWTYSYSLPNHPSYV